MRIKWRSPCLILAALVLMVLPSAALAAQDVEVYAEGAYNAQYLDVYIYANINNGVKLCSYGVKLHYNSLLTTPTVTKNVAVWYMGASSPGNTYMDPAVNTTAREIVFIGGKLDTSTPTSPTDGVTGTRVLLGSVRFVRTETSPGHGLGADSYFSITLERGKLAPYDNFVTPAGTVKDSDVVYSVKVRERGDANDDGSVTPADMIAVRNAYYSGAALANSLAADCNIDDNITPADMICIRNRYYGQ